MNSKNMIKTKWDEKGPTKVWLKKKWFQTLVCPKYSYIQKDYLGSTKH